MASQYIRHVHSPAEMDTLLNEKSVVLLGFHAEWSALCRKFVPFYSQLAAKHRTLTFVKVEIDASNVQSIGQKCRLIALPTFIMIKDKEEVDRIRGANRKGLEEMIVKHVPQVEPTARDAGSADFIVTGDESLLEFLDMRKVNCLNETQHHPLKSIVETKTRNTTEEAYLESDADEQLLITLPFNREVKVRSVVLYTKDSKFGPKKIKIDINKLALGFEDVESATEPAVIQVLEVLEEVVREGKQIRLHFVRLQRVNSLHIFVESNHGNEDVTRIDAIDVYGPGHGEPLADARMFDIRDFRSTHRRGLEHIRLFEREGGPETLSNAVSLFRESVLLCPADYNQRAVVVGNLAAALLSQYEHQGDYADLNESITLSYEILDLHTPGHPERAASLGNLSTALLTRYKREGRLSDLEEAIEMKRETLNLHPPGHPDRASSLDNLSSGLQVRYELEGRLLDLEEAFEMQREALNLRPPGHPARTLVLNNLAITLMKRYEREGSLSDLEEAIEIEREALNLQPPGHPGRTGSFINLANALSTRYRREGSLSDLEEAIEMQREALNLLPGHPARAAFLSNLSTTLLIRFEREGNLSDLEDAIEMQREALNLRPLGHPDRPASLNNLANVIFTRYERKGALSDLEQAIEWQQAALNLYPPDHPDRSKSLINLANALRARYNREGSLSDLEEAIEQQRKALNFCPTGHSGRALFLNNLAITLLHRYEREGSLSDLGEAIGMQQETLDLRLPGHPDRPASLSNLANALSIRYTREGGLSDLEGAIEMQREAVSLCPRGHSDYAGFLNSLAITLHIRYRREGGLSDLEEAIEMQRAALELHLPGHPARAASLINLANSLVAQSHHNGDLLVLEKVIELEREALGLCLPGHPSRSSSLTGLANALITRYVRERNLSDLGEAIEMQREILDLHDPGHPGRAGFLSGLSNSLMTRFEHEGSLLDLEEATEKREKALELLPHGHPERSDSLLYLSRVYLLAINRKGGVSTMHDHQALVDKVFAMLREAVNHSNSPPLHRLQAALQWINASLSLAPGSALDAYSAALDQLDIVLATSSTLASKHTQLSGSKELALCKQLGVEAASCAVRRGDMIQAVEFLERGRNLLFAQIGRYRVELEELQKENAGLAKRFSDLSNLLDLSVVSNLPTLEGRTAFEDPTGRYRRVASDWDQAVKDIRDIPGFENFLRPPRYTTLRVAAAEGPIVIVIPDDDQSHALVILQDCDMPHHIGLPKASREELVTLCNEFIQVVQSSDGDDADSRITVLLRSLWVRVVGPIADALENELRCPLYSRIWWCPSSFLSVLPIHAAGRYTSNADPNQNFPSRYVSSYTPTLYALLRARSKHSVSKGEKMLIVAQPDTPGQGRLPNTIPEARVVKRLSEEKLMMKTTSLSSNEGTHSAVLNGMVNHSWIHLTCHGGQNPANPFDSCFYLFDKKLTLHDIIQRGLPDAKFAFLAACHTSTGDLQLLDEGLHLAAGLHFAGFKSIVGTIWEVADIDGPVIAEAFYEALQPEGVGEEGIDCSRAAHALSVAVKYLRDSGVSISRWIRHIHIGI